MSSNPFVDLGMGAAKGLWNKLEPWLDKKWDELVPKLIDLIEKKFDILIPEGIESLTVALVQAMPKIIDKTTDLTPNPIDDFVVDNIVDFVFGRLPFNRPGRR